MAIAYCTFAVTAIPHTAVCQHLRLRQTHVCIVDSPSAFISHSLTTVTLFPRIIRIRVHQLWNVHILPRMFSALFSSHSSTALRSHTVRLFLPFAELLRSPRATVSRARNVTSPPDIFTSVTSDMWQMPPKPDIFMWKLDSVWNVTPDLIFSHPENQCQHHNVPLLTLSVLDWTYQYWS